MTDTTNAGEATPDSYWDACVRAAERQGLTAACEKLEELFGDDAGLIQSGGFVMLIQVECQRGHFVWVSYEGYEGHETTDGEYLVGYYDEDGQNDTDEYKTSDFANLPEVVAYYRSLTP